MFMGNFVETGLKLKKLKHVKLALWHAFLSGVLFYHHIALFTQINGNTSTTINFTHVNIFVLKCGPKLFQLLFTNLFLQLQCKI